MEKDVVRGSLARARPVYPGIRTSDEAGLLMKSHVWKCQLNVACVVANSAGSDERWIRPDFQGLHKKNWQSLSAYWEGARPKLRELGLEPRLIAIGSRLDQNGAAFSNGGLCGN